MPAESLGSFLKTRRDRTDPRLIGIDTDGAARRVPGLRREELARLAGVSVGYYTRIEQDQTGTASPQVLDALVTAMQLDDAERTHLFNLAGSGRPTRMTRPEPEHPHGRVLALFESLEEKIPAIVLGRRGDVLAWNHSGHELLSEHTPFDAPLDPEQRPSVPRAFFLDPLTRDLYQNWDELARTHVAYLRLTSGRHPRDARLAELIGELTMKSDEFADLWTRGEVADCTVGTMLLAHPTLGSMNIDYQVWLQPESTDHRLEVYTPNDAASRDALRLLPSRISGTA
ncbi:helix-turn-helix transcriptional regulator [Myceligenerans crystallogenes]|uniref:helix-turn-helix transcriptional regulator n=1 Tax=Myceligenerans crystallogenes TaxID=316335 RepID=UPI0031DD2756